MTLPFVAAFFAWKRRLAWATVAAITALFALGAVLANAYPFAEEGDTEVLTAIHLPIALWLVVGVAYAGGGGRWREHRPRMDFIRFTGEVIIYYVLLALGGMVLVGITVGAFQAIGIDIEAAIGEWIIPCGAAGAVVVAAWLVEAKQGVIENMAPVLARIFSPLFTIMLTAFLVATLVTSADLDVERDVLIFFDLLLVLVLGLLLYNHSARDPAAPPGLWDAIDLALVLAALAIDTVVLISIAGRISDFGWSPNKAAAVGENLILLVNLAWSARLSLALLRRQQPAEAIGRWQTAYIPVYGVWAAAVVALFPPLFDFV